MEMASNQCYQCDVGSTSCLHFQKMKHDYYTWLEGPSRPHAGERRLSHKEPRTISGV